MAQKKIVPDGDLIACPCYASIRRIIDENIDPTRIKVMYGAITWRTRSDMIKMMGGVTRFRRGEDVHQAIALIDYFVAQGRLRSEFGNAVPREIKKLMGLTINFFPYETYRKEIEEADANDRSIGIFPIGHDRALPWS